MPGNHGSHIIIKTKTFSLKIEMFKSCFKTTEQSCYLDNYAHFSTQSLSWFYYPEQVGGVIVTLYFYI